MRNDPRAETTGGFITPAARNNFTSRTKFQRSGVTCPRKIRINGCSVLMSHYVLDKEATRINVHLHCNTSANQGLRQLCPKKKGLFKCSVPRCDNVQLDLRHRNHLVGKRSGLVLKYLILLHLLFEQRPLAWQLSSYRQPPLDESVASCA